MTLFFLLALLNPAAVPEQARAQAVPNEAYLQANKEYRDAFFDYLDKKSQVRGLRQAYADAVADVPRKEAARAQKETKHRQLQAELERASAQLEAAKAELERLQRTAQGAEERGTQELDAPGDGDVVEQLKAHIEKLKQAVASYESDIQIEKRKIARVKTSPDYNFYVKEIDIRKKRLERLEQDEAGLNNELILIGGDLTRLRSQKSVFVSRFEEASRALPGLKQALELADRDLDSAQQSGDSFRIQIAESNFHQAHANHRKMELQRNEAELGAAEASSQIEKKEKLQAEKSALLPGIKADQAKARAEWEQLYADYQDYYEQNLKGFETHLAELQRLQAQAQAKVQKASGLSSEIQSARASVEAQKGKISSMNSQIQSLQAQVQSAGQEAAQAAAAVEQAKRQVASAKETHNQAVQDYKQAYTQAQAKQKANADAMKSSEATMRLL